MRLLTLGGLSVVEVDFTRPKPLLLLSYLALEGPRHRRILADLFVPTAEDPRDSLSTAIRQVMAAAEGLVEADGNRLLCRVRCHATELIERLDAGILEAAIDAYDGPFVAGVDLDLAEELEEWLFTTREHLATRVRHAHLRLAMSLAAKGQTALAGSRIEQALEHTEATTWDPDVYRLLASARRSRSSGI